MRALTSQFAPAVVSPVVRWIYLTRVEFAGGIAAWNSGYRNITFDGTTYIASGTLGSISSVREEAGVKSSGITITLSGMKPEIVALLLGENFMNRPVKVYCALIGEDEVFDANKVALLFPGRIDSLKAELGVSASFSMGVRSRLSDWERQRVLRYTDADQKKLYPGDKGLEYVAQVAQKKLIWPRAAFLPDPRD